MQNKPSLVFKHNKTDQELVELIGNMIYRHLCYQVELANSLMNVYYPPTPDLVGKTLEAAEYKGLVYLGDQVIGFLFLKANDNSIHVTELYIEEGHRNQGIGAALMERLNDIAKEFNVAYITLNSSGANPAMTLYHRHGFKPRYVEMVKLVG